MMRPAKHSRFLLAGLGSMGLLGAGGILLLNKEDAGPRGRAKEAEAPRMERQVAESAGKKADLDEGKRRAGSLSRAGEIEEAMGVFRDLISEEGTGHDWTAFARRLAAEAPEKGFHWLAGLPSTSQTRSAMTEFGIALHQRDAVTGMKFLEEVLASSPALRDAYCAGVIKAEAGRSLEKALDLVERVSRSPDDKDSFLRGLAARIAGDNNPQAIVQMAQRYPRQVDAPFLGEALYAIWKNDPAGAQAQMDRIPDAALVAETCNALAYEYGGDNPEQAAGWVTSLPAGAIKDSSAAGLARALSRTQPLESVKWAVSIQGERLRNAALSTLIGPAAGKDLAGTKEIIAGSSLLPAEKTKWGEFSDKASPLWKQPER